MTPPLALRVLAAFVLSVSTVQAQSCGSRPTLPDGLLIPPGGPTRQASQQTDPCRVRFPATIVNPQAQAFLDQGLAQWHARNPVEAERLFRQAARLDPECPVAYWGMALSCLENDEPRAFQLIQAAVFLKSHRRVVSSREALFIEALAAYLDREPDQDRARREDLVAAYDAILARYPDDLEAACLLARQLESNRRAGLPGISVAAADSLLRRVLIARPDHPAQLTRLRLWADHPETALQTALRCGPSSPSSPAMWHEPALLLSKLGRHADALRLFEAAARAHHALIRRTGIHPGDSPGYIENAELWIHELERVGRISEAVERAEQLLALPRHPLRNNPKSPGSASALGRRLLFEVLARNELWDDLIARADSETLPPTDLPVEQIRRLRLLGRALFETGDLADARSTLSELNALAARLEDLEESAPAQTALALALAELSGRSSLADGDSETALRLLREADLKPLALARALAQTGQVDEALNLLAEQSEAYPGEPLPLALLADLRWRNGRLQEAEQAFQDLRGCSGNLDLQAPPYARMSTIARALGYPADWRLKVARLSPSQSFPIASLGPDRLEPESAPEHTLLDARGRGHHLAQPGGRPTIVIFYLGAGCLHCSQQLAAFGPKAQIFQAAGIDLLGISTDDPETLAQSVQDFGETGFPFPLASDKPLDVFRAYHAYDEFAKVALHGTFLIDSSGRILWSDTGDEPFMEPDFLLRESLRLLALDPPQNP